MTETKKKEFTNSRICAFAYSRTSFFTSNHSLFFLLTLLIHASGILIIANLQDSHDEMTMADLDISAVELNLSDALEESLPSPPPTPEPEPPKPEPEKVPETKPEPELQTPEATPPEPEFKPITIPAPESVVLPEPKPEPPEMTPQQPEPLRIEEPKPEPPPIPEPPKPTKPVKQPTVKQPEPETPPSQSPESGAATAMIDQPPKPRRSIKPRYPSGARRRGEEGSVTLDVEITVSGRSRSVSVAESSGFAELDEAARQAVRKARFTPGKNKGESVESQARLTIIFKLK